VIIGVDPHKASHTAVAINDREDELGSMRVRSGGTQVEQLMAWAGPYPARIWAIESAAGLGYLLAQQLVGAGETVVDVPATLASRARLLAQGRSNKNDPSDALSVAVAALRFRKLRYVERGRSARGDTPGGEAKERCGYGLGCWAENFMPGGSTLPRRLAKAAVAQIINVFGF
jgi:transposase